LKQRRYQELEDEDFRLNEETSEFVQLQQDLEAKIRELEGELVTEDHEDLGRKVD